MIERLNVPYPGALNIDEQNEWFKEPAKLWRINQVLYTLPSYVRSDGSGCAPRPSAPRRAPCRFRDPLRATAPSACRAAARAQFLRTRLHYIISTSLCRSRSRKKIKKITFKEEDAMKKIDELKKEMDPDCVTQEMLDVLWEQPYNYRGPDPETKADYYELVLDAYKAGVRPPHCRLSRRRHTAIVLWSFFPAALVLPIFLAAHCGVRLRIRPNACGRRTSCLLSRGAAAD